MNIMLDTNVILDTIAKREPWYQDVAQVWQRIRSGVDQGYVSASALTDIYYITSRILDDALALKAVTLYNRCRSTYPHVSIEMCT